MSEVNVHTRQTTVKDLEKPRLSLTITQEGDTVKFGLNIPKTTGSDAEGPLLQIANKNKQYLFDQAQGAFLKSINSGEIRVERINVSEGLKVGQQAGGNIAAKVKEKGVNVGGEIGGGTNGEVFFKVDGELTIKSGKLGRAVYAAQSALDRVSHEVFTDEARRWVKAGGTNVPVKDYVRDHSGNVLEDKHGNKQTHTTNYKVTPDVAREFFNRFTDGPWEIDRNGDSKGLDIRKHIQGFEGTKLEMHANQVGNAVNNLVSADRKDDVIAAVLANTTNLDRNKDINIAQSIKDPNLLIASQGQGPGILRAENPVDVSKVQPGSAQTVSAELLRNTNTQQVASQPLEQQQEQARGGRGMA